MNSNHRDPRFIPKVGGRTGTIWFSMVVVAALVVLVMVAAEAVAEAVLLAVLEVVSVRIITPTLVVDLVEDLDIIRQF